MNKRTSTDFQKKAFINAILLIILALVILGYFKVDIRTVFSSPYVKDNLAYGWQLVVSGFDQLRGAVTAWIQAHA
jgi:hypothetical protein